MLTKVLKKRDFFIVLEISNYSESFTGNTVWDGWRFDRWRLPLQAIEFNQSQPNSRAKRKTQKLIVLFLTRSFAQNSGISGRFCLKFCHFVAIKYLDVGYFRISTNLMSVLWKCLIWNFLFWRIEIPIFFKIKNDKIKEGIKEIASASCENRKLTP